MQFRLLRSQSDDIDYGDDRALCDDRGDSGAEHSCAAATRTVSQLALVGIARRSPFLHATHLLAAPNLYMQIGRILKRDSWTDELLQEVFVKIWVHAGEYRTLRGAPMTWMSSIARNAALDRHSTCNVSAQRLR
jgi:Sigma-70 region 2